MKKVFIEAKCKGRVSLSKKDIEKLPKNIGLVTTVQFVGHLEDIKQQLEDEGKKVFIGKGRQPNKGQVLGCDFSSVKSIKKEVDCFLYFGSGKFHPLGLAVENKRPVFIIAPVTHKLTKVGKKDIEDFRKRRKVALVKFYSAENIGILVSTKPGQYNLKKAIEIKKKIKDKDCYIFISDNIDQHEFENFPFIQSWVNTACPRMRNKNIINPEEIPDLL